MHDDRALAAMLGEAPNSVDPSFRLEVFAHISTRAGRRAARGRAMLHIAAFTAVGLVLAVVHNAGIDADAWTALITAACALGGAGAFALVTIRGPRAVLARLGV